MSKATSVGPLGLHWFRRDLRIAGNAALAENFKRHQGHVLGLFCFDSKFLERPDFSHNRFGFFLNTLSALQKEMRYNGGDLLVVDMLPSEAFDKLIAYCAKMDSPITTVSFNRDYEPFARKRDAHIEQLLKQESIDVITCRDHLLFEPHEVLKDDGGFYQVYSPFARRWFDLMAGDEGQSRIKYWTKGLKYLEQLKNDSLTPLGFKIKWQKLPDWDSFSKKHGFVDALETFRKANDKSVTITLPEAGSVMAYDALRSFKKKLDQYGDTRDFPNVQGTSRLSIYLKNGSLTVPQVVAYLGLGHCRNIKATDGATKYLKELVWREFYYSILWHKPQVEENAFIEKYNDIKWVNDKSDFELWKQGRTGYPIVDAGMRQLRTTGWMHNRVRMIVASFLTKDLLISWQWGEQYFMEQLLDGDLAPNNGGWQWAASTGCDPQPYFRIFNPKLQSERFDPNGDYIREFVPELAKVPSREIHDPSPLVRQSCGYPLPIVDHHEQKPKALALFKV